MFQAIGSNNFVVILALVFVTVFLLLEALYLVWKARRGPQAQKLQQRLTALSASQDRTTHAQLLKQRMLSELPAAERILLNFPRMRGLDRFIQQAGVDWTVSKILLTCGAMGFVGWLLSFYGFKRATLSGLLISGLLAALPLLYVQYKRGKRLTRFEQQLPEALDLMTRALRAGHAFSAGLKMVGEELPEPIAGEFRIVHDEVNFGVSLEQALTNLTQRIPLTDLRYFVIAVLIQRESGGNLNEILGNLSRLIRERLKLLAKVRVLSSEGRLSAWILGLMPFALAGLLFLANPIFMSRLWTDPIGISIIQYLLGLMVIGVLILRKVTTIRV
jgi:tight adherence protein B